MDNTRPVCPSLVVTLAVAVKSLGGWPNFESSQPRESKVNYLLAGTIFFFFVSMQYVMLEHRCDETASTPVSLRYHHVPVP